jgi:hypothetical protein
MTPIGSVSISKEQIEVVRFINQTKIILRLKKEILTFIIA